MLEIIGFIVWVLIAMWLSVAPIGVVVLSRLGEGLGGTGVAFILICIGLACASWYHIFASLTITLS